MLLDYYHHTEREKELSIPLKKGAIHADLFMPDKPRGLVIFSHGSGSSRKSPRNRFVARELMKHSFASLLADLLTVEEDRNYDNRFDIDLLTDRLIYLTQYAKDNQDLKALPTGYFGASTGAASAIRAAALVGSSVKAVVSRGGRPDLAGDALETLQSPTLLLVGSLDFPVVELNQRAYERIPCEKNIQLVPGATHLFEEPGTLEIVADAASRWFIKYLKK